MGSAYAGVGAVAHVGPSPRTASIIVVICGRTGQAHRLFWMRSAWWCTDCHQKIEACCEGGGCPSIVEVVEPHRSPVPPRDR
jgi:hypothetical protein